VSLLEQPLGEYLAVRRALGYKLERAGKLLAQFPALLDEQDRRTVTTELALEWAMLPPASDFELAPTPLSPSARGGAEGGWSRSSALLCRPPGGSARAPSKEVGGHRLCRLARSYGLSERRSGVGPVL